MVYKWCLVPECTNTSLKTPQKLFVCVPSNPTRRKMWLQLARRDPNSISPHSTAFMCEDHFDMEKDIINYMKYKMGFSQKLLLADEAVPSKFHFQEDHKRRKRKRTDAGPSQDSYLKRLRINRVTEYVKSHSTTETHAESLKKDAGPSQEMLPKRLRIDCVTECVKSHSTTETHDESLKKDAGPSREMLLKRLRIDRVTEYVKIHSTTKTHAESLQKEDNIKQEIIELEELPKMQDKETIADHSTTVEKSVQGTTKGNKHYRSNFFTVEPTSTDMFTTVLLKEEVTDPGIDNEIHLKVKNDPVGTHTDDESIDGTSSLKVEIELEENKSAENQEHNVENVESLLEPIQVANNVSHTEEIKFPKIKVIPEAKCTSNEYQYDINFNYDTDENDEDKKDVYEDPKSRKMIANIYNFLEREYQLIRACNNEDCDLSPLANILKRTSEATGVSKRIIISILKEESQPRKLEESKKAKRSTSQKKGLKHGRKWIKSTHNLPKIKAKENSPEQTTVQNEQISVNNEDTKVNIKQFNMNNKHSVNNDNNLSRSEH